MTTLIEVKPFRVLVAGYINLNVIDGSAFFVAGMAAMLSRHVGVEVAVLTANPILKSDVLSEVVHFPNVRVIDPYREPRRTRLGLDAAKPTRTGYAAAIVAEAEHYDAVLVRDNETAVEVLRIRPSLADKLCVYVTGVSSVSSELSAPVREQLTTLSTYPVRVACQTPDMKAVLEQAGFDEMARRAFILPPHVPDPDADFEELFHYSASPNRLSYAGKFFPDWIPDLILAGFKAGQKQRPDLRLDVAGDHFQASSDRPNFTATVRYLLTETPGVAWHGRLPRARAREVIVASDVGIGWRSPNLQSSAELSTKILEYGALARPAILNRTPAHERLLGADYPLFADSLTEFKRLLMSIADGAMVEAAARRCFEASRPYWYSAVSPSVLEWIGCVPSAAPTETWARLHADGRTIWCVEGGDDVSPVLWGNLLIAGGQTHTMPLSSALLRVAEMASVRREVERSVIEMGSADTELHTSGSLETPDEVRVLRTEAGRLRRQLEELAGEAAYARSRLEALQKSRLGRLQRRVWRLKRRRGAENEQFGK
ncbi:hypothetical protein [Microbacterium sp.]|uniref:hypothetical protein n=1 Tax=Microbacterium sp. TaxID=51671 RepID=UPI00281256BE|nr:hypothetical protein [Microbacterium sp.]